MTKVLPRIWCKVYSNGPHFSATKKDGYTCYVPENLALALFMRAEFAKLDGLWGMDKMSAELERLVLAGAMDEPELSYKPKRGKKVKLPMTKAQLRSEGVPGVDFEVVYGKKVTDSGSRRAPTGSRRVRRRPQR